MLPVAETLTMFSIFFNSDSFVNERAAASLTLRAESTRQEDWLGVPHERSGHRYGAEPLPGGQSRLRADRVPELSGTLQLHTLERQQCRVKASHQRLASRERE